MRVFNPTTSPVVVSKSGRSVAGGEWGDADDDFEGTLSAVDSGVLLSADGPQQADSGSDDPPPPQTTKPRGRSGEKE